MKCLDNIQNSKRNLIMLSLLTENYGSEIIGILLFVMKFRIVGSVITSKQPKKMVRRSIIR